MDPDQKLAILLRASAENFEKFQRLTFILERKGILTSDELAEVYGETPGLDETPDDG
jgi:hypothetical protein